MNKTITIDIKPMKHQRRFFTERRRIDGIYAGRGTGKSHTLVACGCLGLLRGEKIIYVTPTQSLLRKDIMKRFVTMLTSWGIKFSYNKTENTITVGDGVLFGASFENYDNALRGLDAVDEVLVDEIAVCKDLEGFFAVLSPTMRHSKFSPRTLYASTPRKGSQCDKWVKDGKLGSPIMDVTIDDNTYVTEEERENMKSFLTGSLYEQEILGKIVDGDVDFAVFPHELFGKPFVSPRGIPSMGIDVAGQGRDYNVFVISDDTHILETYKIQKADSFELNSIARSFIHKYGITQICLDGTGGFSTGLYDLLKIDKELDLHSINFGQGAKDSDHYANARAEMYFNAAKCMRDGFSVTEDELSEQLKLMSFELTATGKSQLIAKEAIKKVLGVSPDVADAFCLSLYMREKIQLANIQKNALVGKRLNIFG